MLTGLNRDIKLHILTFLTTRKKFDFVEKELTETIESLEEDRGHFFCIRFYRKVQELEQLLIYLRCLDI